jgi:hypothetical protein
MFSFIVVVFQKIETSLQRRNRGNTCVHVTLSVLLRITYEYFSFCYLCNLQLF